MPESVQPEGPIAGPGSFSARVVHWQTAHGRNDLPWQNTRDPYRVWLSEIMLQQTQVTTVKDYYGRFLERFPDVAALAAASQDDVMGLWSGLGYYTRARNLHRCAQQVVQVHNGHFPKSSDVLLTLPGIGRSTAAAIASLCFGERVAILDANVKRVLTRVLGFDQDLAIAAGERALWNQATTLLPTQSKNMPRYTQGMMDLGATLCLPKSPQCGLCPVQAHCRAFEAGETQRYPVRTRKLKRTAESIWMLLAQSEAGDVWLSRRPTPGVWAGLHCLPLFANEQSLIDAIAPPGRSVLEHGAVVTHVLTHKDLYLHPVYLRLPDTTTNWRKTGQVPDVSGRWVAADQWPAMGLPAPIRRLLLDQTRT